MRIAKHLLFGFLPTVISLSSAVGQSPVEPLLQKYCLGCHSDSEREGGLSLQTLDGVKKGGDNGPVFDPGQPEKSLLMQVLADGVDNAMPPEGEPQPTREEKERLKAWIRSGAKIRPMAAGTPKVPAIKPFRKVSPSLLAAASVSPHGVAVAGSRFVELRNLSTEKTEWRTDIKDTRVNSLDVASTKPWIVAAAGMPGVGGRALLLSKDDGSIIKEFAGHTDVIYAATLNASDSLLATAGYDRRILLHDVASGNVVRSLEGHNGSVFSLAFDPTGRVLCSASADGTVKVWNVNTGERLDTLSQPTAEQYAVIVSNNGKSVYAAGADNRIRVWKLKSVEKPGINPLLISRFAHERPITRLAISADGSRLATVAEDGTIQVWATEKFQHFQTLPQQPVSVTSISFIDNVRLYLTRIDGTSAVLSVSASGSKHEHNRVTVTDNPITLPDTLIEVSEEQGNNEPASAQVVKLPALISGEIKPDGGNDRDADCFRFSAKAGQRLLLEVRAQVDKSELDSRIEVLTADGNPILRTKLQAVRDSYFTFRGKDSSTSGDFRVFNWQEMELNQFLYSDGEVVKLWHYPRGPDSGYLVYPGFGKRFTYFGTTPTSHALQAPCFVVEPHHPDEKLTANGLPVFPVYFENDDDPRRELGSDSRLMFDAPADAEYVVRLTDARGFSGQKHNYKLTIRSPRPDFSVAVSTRKLSVFPGTGMEIIFTAKRMDGYEGPVTIDVNGLPDGFVFSGPLTIQAGQLRAMGTIFANADAVQPSPDVLKNVAITAATEQHGERSLGTIEELKLAENPKLRVFIAMHEGEAKAESSEPLVLAVRPGETIRAQVNLDRVTHKGVVSFGKEDAGRNLPHGVYVDNIGLNGLLLLAEQTKREFFITASKVATPSTSTFFLKSNVDGVTSQPVTIRVLNQDGDAESQVTAR